MRARPSIAVRGGTGPQHCSAWAVSFSGFFDWAVHAGIGLRFSSLALAYQFRVIKTSLHLVATILLGVIVWAVLVAAVDDYWLFCP